MARQTVHELILKARDQVTPTVRNVGKSLTTFSYQMRHTGLTTARLGTNISHSLTAPLVALGAVAVNTYAKLEDTDNLVNVIFGKASNEIKDFSSNVDSLGLSAHEAQDMLGSFGAMFQALGVSQSEVAGMSMKTMQRVVDVASQLGKPINEVASAFRAAMRGEYEQMENLNVMASDGVIRQWALQKGLIKTGQELNKQEKGLLAYKYAMEGTSGAEGDFVKTKGSIVNQLRILGANLKNAAADIGGALAPAITKLISVLNENMGSLVEFGGYIAGFFSRIIGWITTWVKKWDSMSEGFKKAIAYGVAFVAASGPLLTAIGLIAAGIAAVGSALGLIIANPIVALIAIIVAALVGAAILIMANWTTVKYWFLKFWDFLVFYAKFAIGAMLDNWAFLYNKVIDYLWGMAWVFNQTWGRITGKTINLEMVESWKIAGNRKQEALDEYAKKRKQRIADEKAERQEQEQSKEEAEAASTSPAGAAGAAGAGVPGVEGTGTGKKGSGRSTGGSAPSGLLFIHGILFQQNSILRRIEANTRGTEINVAKQGSNNLLIETAGAPAI